MSTPFPCKLMLQMLSNSTVVLDVVLRVTLGVNLKVTVSYVVTITKVALPVACSCVACYTPVTLSVDSRVAQIGISLCVHVYKQLYTPILNPRRSWPSCGLCW